MQKSSVLPNFAWRFRRSCWRMRRWRWTVLAAACVAALVAAWPTEVFEQRQERFSQVAPHRLAHLLTDFNNHLQLYPNLGSWSLEDEASNYSSWSYKVLYECGRRCSGRASVALLERPAVGAAGARGEPGGLLQHGQQGKSYVIVVSHKQCSYVPYLPWFELCDEWKSEAQIHAVDGDSEVGSTYVEGAWRRCAAARALAGRCAAELRAARDVHLQQLRFLLASNK